MPPGIHAHPRDTRYWLSRFKEEGLPLPLEEPKSIKGWEMEYSRNKRASILSADYAREIIQYGKVADITPIDPDYLWIFDVPGVDIPLLIYTLDKGLTRGVQIFYHGGAVYLLYAGREYGTTVSSPQKISATSLRLILFYLYYYDLPFFLFSPRYTNDISHGEGGYPYSEGCLTRDRGFPPSPSGINLQDYTASGCNG